MGRMSRPPLDEALDDRRARALLTRLGEPGDAAVVAAVEREGAPAVVDRLLRTGRLGGGEAAGSRAGDLLARADGDVRAQVEADLARVSDLRGEFLVPGDASWPTQVDDLGAQRPLGLWVLGGVDLRFAALRSVAVVGARSATRYGESVAARLAEELAARGWTVVSGGAYGIDAAAHRGALAVDGVTMAVLAGGVDVPYPRAHDALLAQVAHRGAVVSEVPPGCAPMRWRFLVRNRLIAALSRGTVVVEAAARSGSLNTARWAADLGRVVMGVPGPVTSAASQGVHRLLQREGLLVADVDDVVALVGSLSGEQLALPPWPGPDGGTASALGQAAVAGDGAGPGAWRARVEALGLPAEQLRVLDALPVRRPAPADRVARTAGLAVPVVLASLAGLELLGLAERGPQGWRLRRDGEAP